MKKSTAALLQGGYYVLTGVWPVVSMETFEAVTGPKTDDWLVYTVAVLVVAIGLSLVSAALKRAVVAPMVILALCSAAGLATIEFYYVLNGVIWPIYMLDAVGEVVLIALWATALFRDHGHHGRESTIRGAGQAIHTQPIR